MHKRFEKGAVKVFQNKLYLQLFRDNNNNNNNNNKIEIASFRYDFAWSLRIWLGLLFKGKMISYTELVPNLM